MSASPDDEFDKIVEGLDLDLNFDVPEPEPPVLEEPVVDDRPETLHDWEVHRPPAAFDSRKLVSWLAVLGGPVLFVVATVAEWSMPRMVAFAAVMVFVAGAISLVAQLPDHGPGEPDWPDDGAVL